MSYLTIANVDVDVSTCRTDSCISITTCNINTVPLALATSPLRLKPTMPQLTFQQQQPQPLLSLETHLPFHTTHFCHSYCVFNVSVHAYNLIDAKR